MRMGMMTSVLAILAMAAASPAQAQSAAADDDWDLISDVASGTTVAVLAFASGPGIAVICRGGALEAAISGLPAHPEGAERPLLVGFDGEEAQEAQVWINTTGGTIAFSAAPASFARFLRRGGTLTVTATGADDRPRLLPLPLPGGHAGIDQALTACGQPLSDPWDARPVWTPQESLAAGAPIYARAPQPAFPARALSAGVSQGFVSLGCIVGEGGQLLNCRVETESPRGHDFGAAALAAIENARLNLPADASQVVGRRYVATLAFRPTR